IARTAFSRFLARSRSRCEVFCDRFLENSYIEDPMLESGMNAYFMDTGADRWHGLPIIWFKPLLHPTQLKAGHTPCVWWKLSQVCARRTDPQQRLVSHGLTYKYLYISVKFIRSGREWSRNSAAMRLVSQSVCLRCGMGLGS